MSKEHLPSENPMPTTADRNLDDFITYQVEAICLRTRAAAETSLGTKAPEPHERRQGFDRRSEMRRTQEAGGLPERRSAERRRS